LKANLLTFPIDAAFPERYAENKCIEYNLEQSGLISAQFLKARRNWGYQVGMAKQQAVQNQLTNDQSEVQNWSTLDLFTQLVQRYPLIFWGSLWLGLVSLTGFALVNLLSPYSVQQNAQQPGSPKVASSTTIEAHDWNPAPTGLPLWSLGTLVFGCAAGSWLLVYQFNKPEQPRKTTVKKAVYTPQTRHKPAASVVATPIVPIQPKPSTPVTSSASRSAIVPTRIAQPLVTVVPAEESHPLDWGEASLAEMMDIRKQRSLASLMNQAK
jgi:hypothetical protein